MMNYSPPYLLRFAHLATLYPYFFRKPKSAKYIRERIRTPDEDFLDLDWSCVKSTQLVIISHGLEGSTQSQYVIGMVNTFNSAGIDSLAWNFRGCSGSINLKARTYHGGATGDLDTVIEHVLRKFPHYDSIYLVGFSLGANLIAKYLGEKPKMINKKIKKSILVSTPFSLRCSSVKISTGFGNIYKDAFLKSMKKKIYLKKSHYPDIDLSKVYKTKTFLEFDNLFTAPVNGFKNAFDYYKSCSSKQFLKFIEVPTISINALDDPFLGEECYPLEEFKQNKNLTLLTPQYGGHIGFCNSFFSNKYWSESISKEFFLTKYSNITYKMS